MSDAACKMVFRALRDAVGGDPTVRRYYDTSGEHWVDVFKSDDRPCEGVTAFGTIGLSLHPLMRDGTEYGARLELVGATDTGSDEIMANILSSAAFCIVKDHWFCFPGAIFPDVMKMYAPSGPMQHVMFVPPFIWEPALQTIDADASVMGKPVAWLLAVPISESELRLAEQNGAEQLQDRFEEAQIDMFDLAREPVV